jgi:hypothetical protein
MSEEATKKSETKTGDSSPSAADGGKAARTGGAGLSRPTSYFSSVSSNEYRAGWNAIFGSGDERRQAAKPRRNGGGRIEFEPSELDAGLRRRLEAALSAKARALRIAFDEGETSWRLICEIRD